MQPFALISTSIYSRRVCSLIACAQQRLGDRHLPHRLKVWSYLRLICLAMHQHDVDKGYEAYSVSSQNLYLDYLAELSKSSSEWWLYCTVTPNLTLTSPRPDIDILLIPLRQFIGNSPSMLSALGPKAEWAA